MQTLSCFQRVVHNMKRAKMGKQCLGMNKRTNVAHKPEMQFHYMLSECITVHE